MKNFFTIKETPGSGWSFDLPKDADKLGAYLADRVIEHFKYPEEFKAEMIERRLKQFKNGLK